METYVIVGASLAGAKAAETLRAEGFSGRVVMLGEEGERPYERPPLSKGYLLGSAARDNAYLHDEPWYREQQVDLRLAVRATMLNRASREVTLDGGDRLGYDKLLLATGSRVRTLRVPGADLHGVRYLRTLDESDALRASLTAGTRVVVIGAGWIGLETAAAARHHGAEVTVVELDELPLRRVLGDEVARIFAGLHQAHGVRFRFSTSVAEIVGTDGHVTGVRLEDGSELPADVVVAAVGIRPATELAEVAGLAVDNGVVTDERLCTSDPAVFACGDVANSYHPMIGKRIRVEHWANALNGGPAAARSMLGRDIVYDRVPYFFTDQYELGMEYTGYAAQGDYDHVVFRGDPTVKAGAGEYLAFWVAGGRVLAGMNVNVWDVTEPIRDLVRAGYTGRAVDLDRLADPGVPLADLMR
jgi:3-phenylpropionate/trans-cinnamate dioxygenase ferredoxin reductase subunit